MAFRRLDYGFVIASNDPDIRAYVGRVLGRSAVREAHDDWTTYDVVDLGPSEPVTRFRLLIDGRWVLGSGDAGHVLNDLFSHVNLHTLEATRSHVLVHAGSVATPGGVGLVLPAPSGSGKTTLVAGLVRAGFGYLSDEAAVLDPRSGTLTPYPVHLSLKGKSREEFADIEPDPYDTSSSGSTWHVDPESIRPGALATSCQVGFVIAHRYEPGAAIQVERLTPAEACVELAQNLMVARRDTPRSLDALAGICRASRSYRLTHGDLHDAVATIGHLTAT